MTSEELQKEIEILEAQLKALTNLLEEEEIKNKKWWRLFVKWISSPPILSLFSFIFIIFFIVAYLAWKLFDCEKLGKLYESFSYNDGFFWVFIIFIILCNISYLRGIISSIVDDKITSESIAQIREKLEKGAEKISELNVFNKKSKNN